MLEFDMRSAIDDIFNLHPIIPIDFEINQKAILFKLNVNSLLINPLQGTCHGQPVFSDDLHYMIKGNKLLRCTVEQINEYRMRVLSFVKPEEQSFFLQRYQYPIQATNLPKSFGFLLNTTLVQVNDRPISFKGLVGRSHL